MKPEDHRIVTPRLVLRPPVASDFADLFALWRDAETLRYIGKPATQEEAWSRLLKYTGHWALFGYGYHVVAEAATGRFMGEAGLAHQRRTGRPADEIEAGWSLAGWARGQGLAREALDALLAWSDAALCVPGTICLIDPANAASLRLAAACGYRHREDMDLNGSRMMLHLRPSL